MGKFPFSTVIIEPHNVDPSTVSACDTDGDGVPDPPPTPGTDPRCKDPAFAKANPTLCKNVPVLYLKPALMSLCALQSRKLRVYLYSNAVEVEITTGLEWASSNQAKAQIGVYSGKVTGIEEGIVTISVKWQDMTAYSQVTVLPADCCDDSKVGMLLLVDNSKSMTMGFHANYTTKLVFAKELAYRCASELNYPKDVMGLMTFNEAGSLAIPLTNDVAELKTAITAVTSTSNSTNLADALGDAIKVLNDDATLTRRVVILFTDGNNQEGDDPIIIADEFEEAGGLILVVGIRAFGSSFELLNKTATGGFFLNAHFSSYLETPDLLSGLKGYFCAGNCVPDGDVIINKAYLNYFDFENWDVVRGSVDLIGGTAPYDLFDLIPGNGLYVDTAGSAPIDGSPLDPQGRWLGHLVSKEGYDFLSGVTYRVSLKVAGNQRSGLTEDTYQLRVSVGDATTEVLPVVVERVTDITGTHYTYKNLAVLTAPFQPTLLDEIITFNGADWNKPFTEYSFDFTPSHGGGGNLSFELIKQGNVSAFGLLLDDIRLIADPDGAAEVRFRDTFDAENSVFIPPRCGASRFSPGGSGFYGGGGQEAYGNSYAGYFGYNCYGAGCLTTAPPRQTEDPAPQPDTIEVSGGAAGGGGGGGGGGESADNFDPAGQFGSLSFIQEQIAHALAQAQAYADSLTGLSTTNFSNPPSGPNSPEGVVSALPDKLYYQKSDVASLLWIKRTGTGVVGWVEVAGYSDAGVGEPVEPTSTWSAAFANPPTGENSPEGVVTAVPGKFYYQNSDTTSLMWIKRTGEGNTGWQELAGQGP